MNEKVIIKIDAVDSKRWCEKEVDTQARREQLIKTLNEVVSSVYEKADLPFPEGEFISAQGDCIYLGVDDPLYAVLKTIDFQKEWFNYIDNYPDCRAIIDCSDLRITNETPKPELLSEGFENISVVEKEAGKGEIIITERVLNQLEPEIITTTPFISINIADARNINLHKVNYEDPRILEENYLVQTIFVADKKSDTIRDKVIGSIIIGIIARLENKTINKDVLLSELKKKGINLSEEHMIKIVNNNSLLAYETNCISIKKEREEELEKLKEEFSLEKENAISFIAENLSTAIGFFTPDEYRELIDFEGLLEQYLFAVFGDIKNVVLFYNCETKMDFYDKLKNLKYFDSILKEKVKHIKNFNEEIRILFKNEFLRALSLLTRRQSKYISYLFHNILINYYLNRNEKYLNNQLKKIKDKTFYLDTNTFYSYKVPASQYHKKAQYIFDKLKSLSCDLKMLNISVKEYNDTLNNSKAIYKSNPYTSKMGNDIPWIIYEYIMHSGSYGNNIDSFINHYLIDSENHGLFTKKEQIRVEKIEQEFGREELDELYSSIASLKRNRKTSPEKILHDANCLKYLQVEGKGFAAEKVFVTCDFLLAKLRKNTDYGNPIITINELYDLLLPYLLISDDNFANPDRIPNMLLETAIDLELGDSVSLEQIVGEFLKNKPDNVKYEILNNSLMTERFEEIEKKNAIIQNSNLPEEECTIRIGVNYESFTNNYIEEVKGSAVNCLKDIKYNDMVKKIAETKQESAKKDEKIASLEAKVKKLEQNEKKFAQKEKRREKYKKKMENININNNNRKNKKKKRRK